MPFSIPLTNACVNNNNMCTEKDGAFDFSPQPLEMKAITYVFSFFKRIFIY